MAQNFVSPRKGSVWQGIGASAVLAALFLLFLTFSIALAAPQQGVILEHTITIDNSGGPLIEVNPPGMVSIQPTDTQTTQTLTISNTGDSDLLWTIDEQPPAAGESAQTFILDTAWGQVEVETGLDCIVPTELGDIPWIGANPISGTTSAGTADDVAVTFDSTGIDLGVMRADLCVVNNTITPTVDVPVILEVPPAPSLVLTKTVGTAPNVCAATDSINVPAGQGGAAITYCYTAQNTGNITLTIHNLVDDQLGVLLGPDAPVDLLPGASDFFTVSTTITQTTVNSATWTAANASGMHTDPAGDTFGMGAVQHDVRDFSAETNGGTLTLEMAFDGTISPPGSGNPDDIIGFIEIDRDSSPLSGLPVALPFFCPSPPVMGTDYFIDLSSYNSGSGTVLLLFIDEFNLAAFPVGSSNIAFTSNSFTINIPLSMLEAYGPEEGIADVGAVIGTPAEPTDCAPDGAVLTSRLDVSDSDTATVVQDAPTDVALSGLVGTTPMALLPFWLLFLALVAMGGSAVLLRFSGKKVSE